VEWVSEIPAPVPFSNLKEILDKIYGGKIYPHREGA
jgi:hypothetical protein